MKKYMRLTVESKVHTSQTKNQKSSAVVTTTRCRETTRKAKSTAI